MSWNFVVISTLLIFNNVAAENATSSTTSLNSIENNADNYFPAEKWSDTFDWQLLKAFTSSEYRNVLISPISLKLVLALLYEGSGGITEREFQNVLQFPVLKQSIRDSYSEILQQLQNSEQREYILNLGTRIFLDSGIEPKQQYAARALHNYQTEIQATNFTDAENASLTINSWIGNLTEGKVANMVKPGDLQDTIMLITNAIYFKGTWRHKFPKNQTHMGGFYVSPNDIVYVPYMSTINNFFFHPSMDLDAKILRLPYKGKRFSLFIVLPNSKGGLPDLIKKINLQSLKRELYNLDEVPVEVILPKFKFNFQARYSKILQDFGLRQMFQNTASFPGIARGPSSILRSLVVSDIIQKAGIELDEEGSTVFAATDVQLGNKLGETTNMFNATHPFMFFIEEHNSGTILFAGKIENPLEIDPIPLPPRFGETSEQSTPKQPEPAAQIQPLPSSILNLQPAYVNTEKHATLMRFNYFDLELLKEFSESNKNVFISPASIKTTLALILEGAKGKCAQEIGHALRIDDINQKDIRESLQRLLFDLNDRTANTLLETANSIFVSNKLQVLPDYQKKVAEYYKATVNSLDFSDVRTSSNVINNWASNATHGTIREIIGPDSIYPETKIILANALFFKGKWKIAFDEKNTKIKCFNSPTRGCVNTPFMNIGDTFNYNLIVDLNAHAIELPYQDDKYSMLILLPSTGNNIRVLARDMQHAKFNGILDQIRPSDIMLELPKFDIEYSASLADYLAPLKIQEIFGSKANLTGIIPNENIKINGIIHKTKIEVNELGTKAAAATAAVVIPLMGSSSQRIIVDRPFIFFIYHKESRNIIFEGILMEPKEYPTQTSTVLKTPIDQQQYYLQPQQRLANNGGASPVYQFTRPVYQAQNNEFRRY